MRSCLTRRAHSTINYIRNINYYSEAAGESMSMMLENKTRLLLVLSQDVLDQARVIAGKATTALKLPVSLQIVLRALIWVGLKRESHPALFANIESQAKADRQKRSRAQRAGDGRYQQSGNLPCLN